MVVTVTGLPAGVAAAITVTGPRGYSAAVTNSTTLNSILTGTYTVTAGNVVASGQTYTPTPTSQTASVTAGGVTTRSVSYTVGVGSIAVSINGLPAGAAAAVTVTGPNSFSRSLSGPTTLSGLVPGTYTVAAATVAPGGVTYHPTPTSQAVNVTVNATASAAVSYAGVGALELIIGGLPAGTPGSVAVTGPGGFSQSATSTITWPNVAAGSYAVSASNVAVGGTTYVPVPPSQSAAVSAGGTGTATVAYQVQSAATLNLRIAGMYLTQAAAKFDGTTRLIADRDAYLRVFVVANQSNAAAPAVRVRLYSGTTLLQTSNLTSPSANVPLAVNEGTLASSWNMLVPKGLVQPGLKVLADVDPANATAESDEGDNFFPSSAAPQSVDVRAVPIWQVRLVPVRQSVNGLQGNVTSSNLASFLNNSLRMLPVASYAADVRATPYTTNAAVLEPGNGNGAWGTVLNEILALKNAEASNYYYYGVVKTAYSGGVAGMGYVGGTYHSSVGWDLLPSGSDVMAHEVGHNMGRWHSPCGNPSQIDASYPYAGGVIGVWGLDLTTMTLKSPTTSNDFMGYCGNDWVSDYTWNNIIGYRQSGSTNAPVAAPADAIAGLLVWGRITHRGVVLEPSLRVTAPTAMPTGSGRYRIEGLAADGRVLFSYPVEPQHTMTHKTEHEEHFASVLPLNPLQDAELARVRLITPTGPVERLSVQSLGQLGQQVFLRDPAARLTAPGAGRIALSWDAATYPIAMIRDAATGEVLSFARGGASTVQVGARQLVVTFSDGVRSTTRTLR